MQPTNFPNSSSLGSNPSRLRLDARAAELKEMLRQKRALPSRTASQTISASASASQPATSHQLAKSSAEQQTSTVVEAPFTPIAADANDIAALISSISSSIQADPRPLAESASGPPPPPAPMSAAPPSGALLPGLSLTTAITTTELSQKNQPAPSAQSKHHTQSSPTEQSESSQDIGQDSALEEGEVDGTTTDTDASVTSQRIPASSGQSAPNSGIAPSKLVQTPESDSSMGAQISQDMAADVLAAPKSAPNGHNTNGNNGKHHKPQNPKNSRSQSDDGKDQNSRATTKTGIVLVQQPRKHAVAATLAQQSSPVLNHSQTIRTNNDSHFSNEPGHNSPTNMREPRHATAIEARDGPASRKNFSNLDLNALLAENKDLREWLEITQWHNVAHRRRILERRRKIAEFELEEKRIQAARQALLEEEEREMAPRRMTKASSTPSQSEEALLAPPPAPIEVASSIPKPPAVSESTTSDAPVEKPPPPRLVPAKRVYNLASDQIQQNPAKAARLEERITYPDERRGGLDPDARPSSALYPSQRVTSRPPPSNSHAIQTRHASPDRAQPYESSRASNAPSRPRPSSPPAHRKPHVHHRLDLGRNGDTRFFIVKSFNAENVRRCQQDGVWTTQPQNGQLFSSAFKSCKNVILLFSVNKSKAFQGYARMASLPSDEIARPKWMSVINWESTPPFQVEWLNTFPVEFWRVSYLKNSLNESLSVVVGKDGQEIEERVGHKLLGELEKITDREEAALRRDANHDSRSWNHDYLAARSNARAGWPEKSYSKQEPYPH